MILQIAVGSRSPRRRSDGIELLGLAAASDDVDLEDAMADKLDAANDLVKAGARNDMGTVIPPLGR